MRASRAAGQGVSPPVWDQGVCVWLGQPSMVESWEPMGLRSDRSSLDLSSSGFLVNVHDLLLFLFIAHKLGAVTCVTSWSSAYFWPTRYCTTGLRANQCSPRRDPAFSRPLAPYAPSLLHPTFPPLSIPDGYALEEARRRFLLSQDVSPRSPPLWLVLRATILPP